MEDKLLERCGEYAAHFSGLCGVACTVLDAAERTFRFPSACSPFLPGLQPSPLPGIAYPSLRQQRGLPLEREIYLLLSRWAWCSWPPPSPTTPAGCAVA